MGSFALYKKPVSKVNPSRSRKSAKSVMRSSDESEILRLQRTIGNRAVTRMLSQGKTSSPTIQRTAMTSDQFLAAGGAAKDDKAIPLFGRKIKVKEMSGRYKRIVAALDKYHKQLDTQFPTDWKFAKTQTREALESLIELGKAVNDYVVQHKSAQNPEESRNKVVLELQEQALADRRAFEGFYRMVDSSNQGVERFEAFMQSDKGQQMKTLKDLVDTVSVLSFPDGMRDFYGLGKPFYAPTSKT